MPISQDEFEVMPAVAYQDARDLIRNGDIMLFSGTEPFSRIIQHFTDSRWSHVGFIWRMEEIDRIMLLESVEKAGVRAVSLSSRVEGGVVAKPYKGELLVVRHKRFPQPHELDRKTFADMTRFAVDRLGCPYDIDEIAKITLRIAAHMGNFELPEHLKPDNAYICSEYAAECYSALGIDIKRAMSSFVSPADFAADPDIEPVVRLRSGSLTKSADAPRRAA